MATISVYLLTADITKMYRQIRVDLCDIDFQCILWRTTPSEKEVKKYRLLTVTYGITAPFLALRTLKATVIRGRLRFWSERFSYSASHT